MSKGLRVAAIIAGVIAVLALALTGAWLVFSRQAYPRERGTVSVPGLTAPVEILRDPYGVPHIYAENSHDLFFAQGYVHAQDRFWQMEFWRRIGAGRLSEYFGEATLGTDIYLRTVGFARIAEQEYEEATPEIRAVLEAYAEGVNAYISGRRPGQLGLEFALLSLQGIEIEVEPWTPVNTLTWAKIMAQDLGGNMDDELAAVDLVRAVGVDMAQDFRAGYVDNLPVIVPDEELEHLDLPDASTEQVAGEYIAALQEVSTELAGGFDPAQALAFGRGAGIGSNNWVISGDLTASGMPLLANDPHLGIQMPSIWYEIGLHCVEKSDECPYDVRGFSFAGVPGVVIGHNDRIAWGFTNTAPDVQDLYIERINPENPDQYEVNGEWRDMEIVYETIEVQGRDEPVVLKVRITRHGPIITDSGGNASYSSFSLDDTADTLPENLELTALALRWTALQPNTTFQAILELNRATNFEEFRAALEHFDVPSQNMIYADVEGNIGVQIPGLIPIRARGDGSMPVPGWTDDYEWTGFIPYDELPRAYNPAQGYIVTANQPVVTDAYPYLISTSFDRGYRAQRIVDMLTENGGGLTVEDMQRMQGDNLNLSALEILPYLEDLDLEPSLAGARGRLTAWNGVMDMDSPEAALYAYFWVALVEETFNDQLPEDLWPSGSDMTQVAIANLLEEPDNPWWDHRSTPDVTETRDDILARALAKAYERGVEELGPNLDAWRWGDIHTAEFRNGTLGESGIALIERIFNRGPVATSGGGEQVNATGWSTTEPFGVRSLPSMRQIVDLGDLSNSLMIHTTGQSGHPGHRHYDDMIEPWRQIEYHPTLFTREEVEAAGARRLVLRPGG